MKLTIDYSDLTSEIKQLEKMVKDELVNETFEEWLTVYIHDSIFELLDDYGIEEGK